MSKVETITIDTPSGSNTMQIGSTNTATINLGVSGDTINVPAGVTIANAGTATGFGEANTPYFDAKTSSDQTLNHNTVTKISFNTELQDSANAFDSSTNYLREVPLSLTFSVDMNGSSDYVEMYVYIDNGSSGNRYVQASTKYCTFGAQRLIGA